MGAKAQPKPVGARRAGHSFGANQERDSRKIRADSAVTIETQNAQLRNAVAGFAH
jgi:hypothetical protein